jgi:hypothetical protein
MAAPSVSCSCSCVVVCAGPSDADALARVLPGFSGLEQLSIVDMGLVNDTCLRLIRPLARLKSLKRIDFSSNSISGENDACTLMHARAHAFSIFLPYSLFWASAGVARNQPRRSSAQSFRSLAFFGWLRSPCRSPSLRFAGWLDG